MIKIFLIVLFGIWFSNSFSQENNGIESLEKDLFSTEDPVKKMEILIELTNLTLSSDPDRALNYANQTINLAIEYNNPKIKLRAWLQLGDIYWNKSDFRSSLEIGNKAKLLASNLDLDKEYAESLILMAGTFSILGDYEKSSNLSFQALKIFEELADKKGIGEVFNRIGYDHFQQENYDKALEYYTQSLKIARDIEDLEGISRGLNNVAIVYASLGEHKNVKTNIKESIEINKLLGQRLWVGINYSNLGSAYRNEGNFDTAFYYLLMADSIFTTLNNRPKLSSVYYNLSLHYSTLGNLDSSLYYAKLTFEIGQENNLKKTVYNAAKQQRQIYHLQNDFENAFEFSMIESHLKDSLDIENNVTRISHLELLHEFNKIEQENKIKQQRREYILIIGGTAIVFILLILVLVIITRNRLKSKNEQIERRRLNLELESRNKELTANVMSLIRKNEILSGMGDKLMDIQNSAVKEETKSAIIKIARELQHATNVEIWDEFEVRFKQVHSEFYEKLISQFPGLTPNEQKLCAFLRLNMSTKEISELTGQRTVTLEIARWRLRKKLKITNTKTNLVTFLSEI